MIIYGLRRSGFGAKWRAVVRKPSPSNPVLIPKKTWRHGPVAAPRKFRTRGRVLKGDMKMKGTKKGIRLALIGLALLALPATSFAQAPITLNAGIPASLAVAADCDGAGGTTVALVWDALTKVADGSCQFVTVSWLQVSATQMQTTATLTAALTDAAIPATIPAANHLIKMVPSGNAFNGDISQVTAYTALSAPVNIWQELVGAGEQNRSDIFQVDFRMDGSTLFTLAPGTYPGTVTLTVSTF